MIGENEDREAQLAALRRLQSYDGENRPTLQEQWAAEERRKAQFAMPQVQPLGPRSPSQPLQPMQPPGMWRL